MKIISDSTPLIDGYRMPAEVSSHSGCIIIFPERPDSWQYGGVKAKKAFCEVACAIAKSEKVTVLASFEQYENARRMLPPHIRVVEMSSDDAWARDVSPEFVVNDKGDMRGVDWYFNAWGGLVDGLYFPWDKDNKIARKVCDMLDVDVYDFSDFVLEGGSISADGEGTILTTEACLLSAGRNPQLSKAEIEENLCEGLGAKKVIWLPGGILGDETNEHVDNICVFAAPHTVLLSWCEDETSEQYRMCRACLDVLENSTDALGRKIDVVKLAMPRPIYMTEEEVAGLDLFDGEPTRDTVSPLSASYVNLYIGNKTVVMPAFGGENTEYDLRAKSEVQKVFPDREIIQIYARDILIGGGNIHCITHQIPSFVRKETPYDK